MGEEIKRTINTSLFKIKHTYIDFQPLIFQRKLDFIFSEDIVQMTTSKDRNISWKELSEICIDILEQDQDIEEKEVL